MLIITFILLALCLFVRLFHALVKPAIPWSTFTFNSSSLLKQCQTDQDCPFSNQTCFQHTCMEAEASECQANSGYWTKTLDNKLKCVCKKPDLLTQNADGMNCAVDVGWCGIYGRLLSIDPIKCECDPQFKSGPHGKCIKKNEADQPPVTVCPNGTLHSKSAEAKRYFHPDYLRQFRKARCLRNPCSFNVLNNKPLEHTAIVRDRNASGSFRCLCSPQYGHFGVHLQAHDYLKSIPGSHNACASIYEEEPEHPKDYDFKFYCYFYIDGTDKPVCFLVFEPAGKGLASAFEGKRAIGIFDEWPHSYCQYMLQNKDVAQTIRFCHDYQRGYNVWYKNICKDLKDDVIFKPPLCSNTPNKPHIYESISFANNIYAYYFVCKMDDYLQSSTPKVIVNPFAIDYVKSDRFSHGYQLYYSNSAKHWKVKPAPVPLPGHLSLDLTTSTRLMGHPWQHVKGKKPWDPQADEITVN